MKDKYLASVSVLFVDDEDGVRESFETLLTMWCKKAYVASDGEMGYEVYKSHKPDIVITDIKMPKSTGLDMIARIREEDKELPIFISTAFENSEYLHEAIKLQVSGYLVKPIAKKDLKLQISAAAKNIVNEKELERINKKNQLYLDMASDLMVALDKDGNIDMINKNGAKLLGVTQEEVLDRNWFDLNVLPPESKDEVKDYFFKLITEEIKENEDQFENDLITKDGRRITLSWHNRVLKNKHEDVTGTFSSAMDITELKQLQTEKLKQQQYLLTQSKIAALGEMIANISHQWRQPLSVISTHVSGMKLNLELGKDVSQEEFACCADNILSQVEYLSKTIEDFIHFYQADHLTIDKFNLKDTIKKLQNLISHSFEHRDIDYIFRSDSCELVQNENLLIQAMLNICNNAKDALENISPKEDRCFFITVSKVDNSIIIVFKDSGGGIQEDIMEKVFEPYFTTKHQSVGTGIGLYMTHQIITKHFDGNIKVINSEFEYNSKKHKGAEFTITIPIISNTK